MKILCVSDQIDPLVYSNNVKERFKDVDLVISAGDLPMEYLDFIVSSLNKPVFFVFGNHNLNEYGLYHKVAGQYHRADYTTSYHGTTYLGFKAYRQNGLLLAGASGSIRYNNGLNQYTDRQMGRKLLSLVPRLIFNKIRYGRYLDVFVTHASPEGIHDKSDPCHHGFKSFLWFMKTFRPKYLIHGHIHLYDLQDVRVSTYQATTVINAYSHYNLDVEV